MMKSRRMKSPISTAIILAAGRGTKCWPYGDTQPKATITIANRSIIQWQITQLSELGIQDFVIVVGYLAGEVRAAVGDQSNVTYIEQAKPTGSADAFLRGLAATDAEHVLVVWGDTLWTTEDARSLLERYAESAGPILLVDRMGGLNPQDWLCPRITEGNVTAVYGHPREADFRHAGLMAVPRSFGDAVSRVPERMSMLEVGVMPIEERELLDAVNVWVSSGKIAKAVVAEGIIIDIDKPWHILEANSRWLEDQAKRLTGDRIHPSARVPKNLQRDGYLVVEENAVLGADVKLKGTTWIGAGAQIIDGAIVCGVASIGREAKVHQYCQIGAGTSIGKRCVVGHGAEFSGVLMEGAYAYHYGEYWGVLGRHADLGAATVCGNLRFDDLETEHRIKGRREIPNVGANAAYLGDYVRTGVNAILMPGVKVGPYSVIGAGVILQEDLPNGTMVYVKQELVKRSWGPERYGW